MYYGTCSIQICKKTLTCTYQIFVVKPKFNLIHQKLQRYIYLFFQEEHQKSESIQMK